MLQVIGARYFRHLLLMAVVLLHYCVTCLCPASNVAPFMHSQIFWALGFGYLYFGALTAQFAKLGGVTVIANGIYPLRRQKI